VGFTLKSEEIRDEEFNNTEFVCVKLTIPSRFIYITCSYIPPASEFPEYLIHLFDIQSVSNKLFNRDHLVVLEDFNILGVTWTTDEKTNVLLPLAHHDFTEGLLDISLSQANYLKNLLVY